MGGQGGLNLPLPVSSTPASRTFNTRFPPLSVVLSSSLSHFYCKILRNVAKYFSISPGSRHLSPPASRSLFSRLLPLFPRAPALLSPPHKYRKHSILHVRKLETVRAGQTIVQQSKRNDSFSRGFPMASTRILKHIPLPFVL